MSFSGRIEDFRVTDVMQYLHMSGKTGTLRLNGPGRDAWVRFRQGRIIQVKAPGMTNLGDLLLKPGHVTRKELKRAVGAQGGGNAKPLGMILEQQGIISHDVLRDTLVSQIEEVVVEVAGWDEGSFDFEIGDGGPGDDIAVSPEELIPPEEIDTKDILLGAVKSLNEANDGGPEKQTPSGQNKQKRLSLPAEPVEPGPRAGSMAQAEDCIVLLKNMMAAGRGRDKSDSITVFFLKILASRVKRAVLFMPRKDKLLCLSGFGNTADNGPVGTAVKNLRLELGRDDLANSCISDVKSYSGVTPDETWLKTLHTIIGAPADSKIGLVPVAGVEKFICLVYVDNDSSEIPLGDMDILEVAAGQTGIILENTLLRRRAA